MKWKDAKPWAAPGLLVASVLSLALGAAPGCGGKVDDRFAAETYDEYTEPLTQAIIGTPQGVTTVGAVPVAPPPISGSSGGVGGGGSSSSGGFIDAGPDDGGVSRLPDGGIVGGEGGTSGGGSAQWHFDDCSPTSNFLVDGTGGGANAQHALGAACVPGISGLGVQFRSAKDIVQVPDEPEFTVSSQIALAAWVHPTTVSGNQPIIIKRLNNQTSFSLGIHNGNIEMSVVLTNGTTVISRAPIQARVWSHVAGMYDGTFVFLFINGQQFGQVFGGGTLRNVFAPLRIGATTQNQHFDGIIDEPFVSTAGISKDQLAALSCISQPTMFTVDPQASGPVPFDTAFRFDLKVTDNDVGFCQPKSVQVFNEFFDPTINVTFDASQFQNLSPGQTVDFGIVTTPSEDATLGDHGLLFALETFTNNPPFTSEFFTFQVTLQVVQPSGCFVFSRRELFITNTSVVDDPVRTFGSSNAPSGPIFIGGDGGVSFPDAGVPLPPDAGNSPSLGVWSFGHLMREMAPTPAQAPAMVLQLLEHWLTNQTVNGFTVPARTRMQGQVIDLWP
ncbi:MAG: LamG domain-containing protein, partial [Myxococcales bacterium]|nr:LamG domain-containing protein [Myxococcales bacterium]